MWANAAMSLQPQHVVYLGMLSLAKSGHAVCGSSHAVSHLSHAVIAASRDAAVVATKTSSAAAAKSNKPFKSTTRAACVHAKLLHACRLKEMLKEMVLKRLPVSTSHAAITLVAYADGMLKEMVLKWLPVSTNQAINGEAPELGDSPIKAGTHF
ncbi:hypothetical protein DUNSADRAFT_17783 [Dunaliella salina]|uniref:Encoded protein n=1 Tax=Dunaliella salina TaxID=3046 RepID=A0ABQ7G144_DUNSA|nr:hypothetical protein DUNSADRAFT_17783 [Dunaliella salina]|eukprot:KAF5828316.1 hypothetical protein DUNSADRAFT_17783 [Dunaliella salina]